MTWASTKLRDFFEFYDPTNPNHVAAADLLQKLVPEVMDDQSEWVQVYRTPPKKETADRVPAQAIELIKKYEGFRADPYICPAGVATIGYGNTYYPGGRKVQMGDPAVSFQDAEQMLRVVVEKDFVSVLEKTIPYWEGMSNGQRSALISFAYNLGANFCGDTNNFGSITRDLKNKDWANVPNTLLLYRNPGSAFEEGLRRRRTEEGEVWLS